MREQPPGNVFAGSQVASFGASHFTEQPDATPGFVPCPYNQRLGMEHCFCATVRTGKVQTLIVPEPMRAILRAWHVEHGSPEAGPVFPVTKGARTGEFRKMRGVSYASRLRSALWRMGIRDHDIHNDTPTSRRVDWHSFRRAFATSLAEAGVNEQTARLLVAHGDANVHARYVQQTRAMQLIPAAAVPAIDASTFIRKGTAVPEPANDVSLASRNPGNLSTPGMIRTYDIRLRRPALYPAELRAQVRRK